MLESVLKRRRLKDNICPSPLPAFDTSRMLHILEFNSRLVVWCKQYEKRPIVWYYQNYCVFGLSGFVACLPKGFQWTGDHNIYNWGHISSVVTSPFPFITWWGLILYLTTVKRQKRKMGWSFRKGCSGA